MKKETSLLERLKAYQESDMYPFHMPGHKRRKNQGFAREFPNPFCVDITEIEGFDNLHHPEGILKESTEWAASVYGADRTYYLVNGSSCGILSAICGTTNNSDTILLCRNSHKSAYHGVFLNHLRTIYIYPQIVEDYCVQGGLLPDEIENMLKTHVDIRAIFVVSPTYDGIVSNIEKIAKIAHKYKIPLIVDEAHGAHFRYGKELPASALELGADVVIQSLHKTLPSFTQTALLHVKEGLVDVERIERYLHIFQSSSPSYVFMAGIENCIRWMEEDKGRQMEVFAKKVLAMRQRLGGMKGLKLMDRDIIGRSGVFDLDWSKVVISTRDLPMSGVELDRMLRERYHLEMEMCSEDYVTAITTFADTGEGLARLEEALMEIDRELWEMGKRRGNKDVWRPLEPEIAMTIYEAMNRKAESVSLEECQGRISGEYVYVYPPGIPIVAPGEVLSQEVLDMIRTYRDMGLSVQGTRDPAVKQMDVVVSA